MPEKQRKQEQQIAQESIFDVVLQETLEQVLSFDRKIIALYCRDMPSHKTVNDRNFLDRDGNTYRPVFMRTGVKISKSWGFMFERESLEHYLTPVARKEETYPKWFDEWSEDPIARQVYVGIDVNEKHIPEYFEILAKMRIAYDFARERETDIFLPRIYGRLQRQGKTIGILTEDLSFDECKTIDEISEEEFQAQEKAVPLSKVFKGDLERSYFSISRSQDSHITKRLLALVDVDHLYVTEAFESRYLALKKWYERRDPFVISLDEIKL